MSTPASTINKARFWVAVLYLENMLPNWKDVIDDLLELPFAYCVHMADLDSKSEHRKDHVHIILAFPNTTTYKHAMEVFSLLSAPGKKALNTCQAVISIRSKYDYLIHDTKKAREQGKHLYDASARVTGNNFDIGAYEQVTQEDKNRMLREMLDFVVDNDIKDISTFYVTYAEPLSNPQVFDVFKSYGSLIERLCKGNHHRSVR